jgi:hypothetical protein
MRRQTTKMMDHQEATASLDLFSNELVNLCATYNFLIDKNHERKNEIIAALLTKLKGVQKEALVVNILVSEAIGEQCEQLVGGSIDGLTKLLEASNRNRLATEQADGVLRAHEQKVKEANTPKINKVAEAVQKFREQHGLVDPKQK